MSPSDGNSRDVGGGCIFRKHGPSEPQGEHLNPGHPNAQRTRRAGEETTPLPPGCLTHSTVSCSGKSSSPASWPRQGQPCAFHTLPVAPSSLWRAEGWSWMPEGRLYPPSEVGKPSSTGRTAGCLAPDTCSPIRVTPGLRQAYGFPEGRALGLPSRGLSQTKLQHHFKGTEDSGCHENLKPCPRFWNTPGYRVWEATRWQ